MSSDTSSSAPLVQAAQTSALASAAHRGKVLEKISLFLFGQLLALLLLKI